MKQTDIETIIKEKMTQAQARANRAGETLPLDADGLPPVHGVYSGGEELALYMPYALESGEVLEDIRLLFSVELGEPFTYGDHPDYGGGVSMRPINRVDFDQYGSDDTPKDLVELAQLGAFDKHVSAALNG